MDQLLEFLAHLESIGIGYLLQSDAESVIVLVRTQSGIHEIAFYPDGAIEIQTFAAPEAPQPVSLDDLVESFKAE